MKWVKKSDKIWCILSLEIAWVVFGGSKGAWLLNFIKFQVLLLKGQILIVRHILYVLLKKNTQKIRFDLRELRKKEVYWFMPKNISKRVQRAHKENIPGRSDNSVD